MENTESLRQFPALDGLGDTDQAGSLFYRGEDLLSKSRTREALACFIAAERFARVEGRHDLVLRCLERRSSAAGKLEDSEEALLAAIEALTYVRLLEREEEELPFIRLLARVHQDRSEFKEATALVFEGLELARKLRRPLDELTLIADLAEISICSGDAEGAMRHAQAGLARAVAFKDSGLCRAFASLAARAGRMLDAGDGRRRAADRALAGLPPLPLSI